MYNAIKDFNKIKVWINFKVKYEHPKETARDLWAMVETVYKYYDEFEYGNIKKIDRNLIKYVVDNLEKYCNSMSANDDMLNEIKPIVAKKWNTEVDYICTGTYAIPTARIQFTLTELVTLHKVLEFAKHNRKELREHILCVHEEVRHIQNMMDLQEQINERIIYALCISD